MTVPLPTDTTHSPFAALKPYKNGNVGAVSGFWGRIIDRNLVVSLPGQFELLESTGRLDNFRRAAGDLDQSFKGRVYDDSDVYKWLEAAAWSLGPGDRSRLEGQFLSVVKLIERAQDTSGYLMTYFTHDRVESRWTNLRDAHELYCAGHLINAALADHRTSGRTRLLEVATRLADHIQEIFGADIPGHRDGTGGHPGIEMALVELYRSTGRERYLRLAETFLDRRGRGLIGGDLYHLDHAPFRELHRLEGHAVRAVYLAAGAADIYMETGERALLDRLESLWERMTARSMYITGGIGSRASREAFGDDYELPNQAAYAESCAAIGSFLWSWRMLQATGRARYADLMERIMYNAALVGVSEDGAHYFYSNPLADEGDNRRQSWFSCACCPPNLARWIASFTGYAFSERDRTIWVHQYLAGDFSFTLDSGQEFGVRIDTDYPIAGEVKIKISGQGTVKLLLRVPGWCRERASVIGPGFQDLGDPGTYVELNRNWQSGDEVRLSLPMDVTMTESHPAVEANRGKIAVTRGPLVFCLEQADNPELNPQEIGIQSVGEVDFAWMPGSGFKLPRIQLNGYLRRTPEKWSQKLYQSVDVPGIVDETSLEEVHLYAVPYHAWGNRSRGWMRVWVDFIKDLPSGTYP